MDFTTIDIIIMATTVYAGLLFFFEIIRDITIYLLLIVSIVAVIIFSIFGVVKSLKYMWNF